MQDEAKRMIEAYSQVPEEAEYTIVKYRMKKWRMKVKL
jgi:hypothetical protein